MIINCVDAPTDVHCPICVNQKQNSNYSAIVSCLQRVMHSQIDSKLHHDDFHRNVTHPEAAILYDKDLQLPGELRANLSQIYEYVLHSTHRIRMDANRTEMKAAAAAPLAFCDYKQLLHTKSTSIIALLRSTAAAAAITTYCVRPQRHRKRDRCRRGLNGAMHASHCV